MSKWRKNLRLHHHEHSDIAIHVVVIVVAVFYPAEAIICPDVEAQRRVKVCGLRRQLYIVEGLVVRKTWEHKVWREPDEVVVIRATHASKLECETDLSQCPTVSFLLLIDPVRIEVSQPYPLMYSEPPNGALCSVEVYLMFLLVRHFDSALGADRDDLCCKHQCERFEALEIVDQVLRCGGLRSKSGHECKPEPHEPENLSGSRFIFIAHGFLTLPAALGKTSRAQLRGSVLGDYTQMLFLSILSPSCKMAALWFCICMALTRNVRASISIS